MSDTPLRVHQLEFALEQIGQYARGAQHRVAAQVKRHLAGESTTPWDAEDVVRVLCHIRVAAETALEASRQPSANGHAGKGGAT